MLTFSTNYLTLGAVQASAVGHYAGGSNGVENLLLMQSCHEAQLCHFTNRSHAINTVVLLLQNSLDCYVKNSLSCGLECPFHTYLLKPQKIAFGFLP